MTENIKMHKILGIVITSTCRQRFDIVIKQISLNSGATNHNIHAVLTG